MNSRHRAAHAGLVMVVVAAASAIAASQARQEFRYNVGSGGNISVANQFGPISVKAGSGNQIVVIATLRSGKVEVDQTQSGNRVEIISHLLPGANSESGRIEYDVLVPADCSVSVKSTTGPLQVEGLHGDVSMEGPAGTMEAHDLHDAHVHVKTLNATVNLANIQAGHVEVTSVNGDVTLNGVDGPFVQVNSTTGHIRYDGDFGSGGDYRLSSHSGDIDAVAPMSASFDVIARSERGRVENDFLLQPKHTPFAIKAGSAFAGTMGKAASSVKLFSFSGKIHLKKR